MEIREKINIDIDFLYFFTIFILDGYFNETVYLSLSQEQKQRSEICKFTIQ